MACAPCERDNAHEGHANGVPTSGSHTSVEILASSAGSASFYPDVLLYGIGTVRTQNTDTCAGPEIACDRGQLQRSREEQVGS